MPIPVACACGAKLRVGDQAAGKKAKCPKCGAILVVPAPEAAPPADDGFRILTDEPAPAAAPPPAPDKACPFCAETIPGKAAVCPHCRSSLRAGGGPPIARRPMREAPSAPVAWEVWIVIALIGLGLLGNLVNGNVPGIVVGALMFIGLLGRTGWGWWLTVILSSLAGIGVIGLATMADGPEMEGARMILVFAGILTLGQAGLLILCRARGAYFRD